ncbi:MAG TPA: inositol monophosphatase family protein [Solirubrobacteraceae bacterium]|nr:inositol monophosphatase family protein [Solirubrobacteraceae bacterium]
MAATQDDLALALELANVADAITVARFGAADLVVETKPDMTPVTEADTAVERTLRERLASARPGDAILGEEYGSTEDASENGRRWIVDPIDGTMNYVRGIPVWGTLLALQDGDQFTVGVVSAPALQRRWWAARGAGAFVRDGLATEPRRLRVSSVRGLESAQLCISGFDGWEANGALDRLLALSRRCWRTRGFGDFWIYMLVAEGVADVACEAVVSLWDLAAPQMIVEEAGGTFTDLAGVPTADGGDALASNGWLHEEALAIVRR